MSYELFLLFMAVVIQTTPQKKPEPPIILISHAQDSLNEISPHLGIAFFPNTQHFLVRLFTSSDIHWHTVNTSSKVAF